MKIYPSDLNLVKHCPGMATLRDDIRDSGVDTSTSGMTHGRAAHMWIEEYLNTGSVEWADTLVTEKCDGLSEGMILQVLGEMKSFADWMDPKFKEGIQEIRVAWEHGGHIISGKVDWMNKDHSQVADWKRYQDASYLSPIEQDWQMLAYGAMVGAAYGQKVVTVHRVLVIQRWTDTVEVEVEPTLERMKRLVEKVTAVERASGTWCNGCYVRHFCPDFRALAGITEDLQPYRGGPIQSISDAIYWLRRVGPAKERVEELEEALKAFAKANGGIHDPETEKTWNKNSYKYDKVVDQPKVMRKLAEKVGPDVALGHAFTSKKAMTAALTEMGWERTEVNVFLQELRSSGLMTKLDGGRFQWGAAPKNGEAK